MKQRSAEHTVRQAPSRQAQGGDAPQGDLAGGKSWLEPCNWALADAVCLALCACFLAAGFALAFYIGAFVQAGLYLTATIAVGSASVLSFGLADEICAPGASAEGGEQP